MKTLSYLNKIPPLWELDSFVAVNPFLGWSTQHFGDAIPQIEALLGKAASDDVPRWKQDTAATLLGSFLASYYERKSAIIPAPWKHLPLFTAWKMSLPGSTGLVGATARRLIALVSLVPDTPAEALAFLVSRAGVADSEPEREKLILQILSALPGWASYLRKLEWPNEPGENGPLVALACMLLIVNEVCGPLHVHHVTVSDWEARYKVLEQREKAFRSELRTKIRTPELLQKNGAEQAPRIRAAFCIDVRSEVFRTQWEARNSDVASDGFAGFFALAMEWQDDDMASSEKLLPVLLSPTIKLEARRPRSLTGARKIPRLSKLASHGPSGFPFVEASGWFWGLSLLIPRKHKQPKDRYPGLEAGARALPLAQKVALVEGVLKNLGWGAPWSELMLFVGHGSSSANNPHAAGLDCGACGGKTGEANARVAAALCNDPEVRAALAEKGRLIPDSTLFLGALHNTTLDTVTIFDAEAPARHAELVAYARKSFSVTAAPTRARRQEIFSFLDGTAHRRANDWAETRPEAALANNSAFIVAPRFATRGADLGGRAFLHSYDTTKDHDGSVLELILTAPAVVASWINLQYFASTTAPENYGGGNKVLHSIVGGIGVYEGNSPDLKTGLALQSVAWKDSAYHEALRLQVWVQAPRGRVDYILAKHPSVADLFDNEWVILLVQDELQAVWRRARGSWIAE